MEREKRREYNSSRNLVLEIYQKKWEMTADTREMMVSWQRGNQGAAHFTQWNHQKSQKLLALGIFGSRTNERDKEVWLNVYLRSTGSRDPTPTQHSCPLPLPHLTTGALLPEEAERQVSGLGDIRQI